MLKVARYWNTLAALKAIQMSGRVLHRLRLSHPDLRPAQGSTRRAVQWTHQPWRRACITRPIEATFHACTCAIDSADAWTRDDVPLLWLYNLHYFDDLTAEGADQRREWQHALVQRWISEHPPGTSPGWDPYPTSLRLVNWIKTAWAADSEGRSLIGDEAVHSMAVQTRWLARHIEYHLQANHLWANAKALVFAGAFFDSDEGVAWRNAGAALAVSELQEQVLRDGGHYERSPMYHAVVLEDVLDLIQLAQCAPGVVPAALVTALHETAPRMLRWLQLMSHPDGGPAFFNDAALQIAPRIAVLERYAQALGVQVPAEPFQPVEWMRESGYVRLTSPRAMIICDVAPVGPDYQPGHAHADTLSFELSVNGKRRIVNSGTSTYERNRLREWQRSTEAHNTVVVNRENSSDVWAAFRVGRRARIKHADAGVDSTGVAWATGTHDGYARGRNGTLHARRWELNSNGLVVRDTLSSHANHAEAYLYFAPETQATVDVSFDGAESQVTESAMWYPEFGREIATTRMRATLAGRELVTTFRWAQEH